MVTRLALLIGFALLLSGCTAAGLSAVPPTDGPAPGPRNQLLPIFQRPFAGGFWLSNFFDHEFPLQFQDNNGFQRTFRGEARAGGIDGHNGYDWRMDVGTPILAVADGDVVFADLEEPFFCPPLGRTVSGLFVLLEHLAPSGDRFLSGYAHLDRIDVTRGQRVSAGQQIASRATPAAAPDPTCTSWSGGASVTGGSSSIPSAGKRRVPIPGLCTRRGRRACGSGDQARCPRSRWTPSSGAVAARPLRKRRQSRSPSHPPCCFSALDWRS